MKVLDPGHRYLMSILDGESFNNTLQFVKRDDPPDKYPGNEGHYPGVTIQEVLRVLIDRTQYLLGQAQQLGDIESEVDDQRIMSRLREAMIVLELRTHRQHGSVMPKLIEPVETYPACVTCGHILCTWRG